MATLRIMKETTVWGSDNALTCFLDNQKICKVENNTSKEIEVEKKIYKFKCKVFFGSMSETITLDFKKNDFIQVTVKERTFEMELSVSYMNKNEYGELERSKKDEFIPTKKVGNRFYIDEIAKKWTIPDNFITGATKKAIIYNYSDVINYELIEDGNNIAKGGLGRAITGGILFGGVGAIVGGMTGGRKTTCSKLEIVITLRNTSNPIRRIPFINTSTKKDSLSYMKLSQEAQEIASFLQIICDFNNTKQNQQMNCYNNNNVSVADEIKKFKELLDINAITQEEYDAKKDELLKK